MSKLFLKKYNLFTYIYFSEMQLLLTIALRGYYLNIILIPISRADPFCQGVDFHKNEKTCAFVMSKCTPYANLKADSLYVHYSKNIAEPTGATGCKYRLWTNCAASSQAKVHFNNAHLILLMLTLLCTFKFQIKNTVFSKIFSSCIPHEKKILIFCLQ